MPTNEITLHNGAEVARHDAHQPTQEPSLMEIIASVAANPNSDVAKMRELLEMRRQVMKDDAAIAFNRAMSSAQEEMRPVVRDAENKSNNSRYARLETIDAAIRPIYARNGFALTFNSPATDDKGTTISCTVLHAAGHSKDYSLSGALDMVGPGGKPNKTAIQGLGSTVSYLKRYLTCMVFNVTLTNEDDDGNTADPISDHQAMGLHDMIEALAMTPPQAAKFWAWVQEMHHSQDVGKPEAIQKAHFDKVHRFLADRIKAVRG